jgi:hypothetical protein
VLRVLRASSTAAAKIGSLFGFGRCRIASEVGR